MKKTESFIISAMLLLLATFGVFLLINPAAVYKIMHFGWVIAIFIIGALLIMAISATFKEANNISAAESALFNILAILLIPLMIVGVAVSQNKIYDLYTAEDMKLFGNAPINHKTVFVLQDDIDFEEMDVSKWYGRRKSFEGIFEGNGYTFYNIEIELTDMKIEYGSKKCRGIGFIGTNLGTIRNLNFENCRISAHFKKREHFDFKNFGIIAAVNYGGKVYDCNVIDCQARYLIHDSKDGNMSLSVGFNSQTSYYGKPDDTLIRVNVVNNKENFDESFYKTFGTNWKKIGVEEEEED